MVLAAWVSLSACAEDFEFVVIGDTRPRFESESFRPFEELITKINSAKPELVVNLGDLIYGYGPLSKEHQWKKYEEVIKALRVPYYQAPGNHDTHSKDARRIYGERFGKFYQSFDHGGCHFVLLDNTEDEKWGYLGPKQLSWLRTDLSETRADMVFVFLHFPVWDPERVTPEYHEFWLQTLHPLFKSSRVRAVFGGHYHTYGPTREFDGIRYFITGGGGAELRPEYTKAGGRHHFMRVKVLGGDFDVRVVTAQGELTDSEADVMGGLQFASRNVSRLGIRRDPQELKAGVPVTIAVKNPYRNILTGEAVWLFDASAFSIQPETVALNIPSGATRSYPFTLKALRDSPSAESLPQLEFRVVSGRVHHQFHREVRFIQELRTPYRPSPPVLDGFLSEWEGIPSLKLGNPSNSFAELRSCYDERNLYLALTVPQCDAAETKELGLTDEIQLGLALPLDFSASGGDILRLGLNSDSGEAKDRTPGSQRKTGVPGTVNVCRLAGQWKTCEVSVPLDLLKMGPIAEGTRVLLDVSFPVSEPLTNTAPSEPAVNTLSYRVRYGSDSLVPLHFVELNFQHKQDVQSYQ